MLERLKNVFLYAGITKEAFERILDDEVKSNYQSLRLYSKLAMIMLVVMSILDCFLDREMDVNQKYYYLAMVITLIIGLITKHTRKDDHLRVDLLAYSFLVNFYLMGILIMMAHTNYPTVILMSLLVVMPLLFVMQPYKMMILTMLVASVSFYVAIFVEEKKIGELDVYYTICFTLLSLIEDYISNHTRMNALIAHHEVRYLSERDSLTGLYNRTKYEAMKEKFTSLAEETFSVVYGDVNGLHEMNNEYGHSAGDQMLKICAQVMHHYLGSYLYRIGGDEFIAIIFDESEEVIINRLDLVVKTLQKQGYSVSFGFFRANKNDYPIKEMEKKAEAQMYQMKRVYYQNRVHDRRKARM